MISLETPTLDILNYSSLFSWKQCKCCKCAYILKQFICCVRARRPAVAAEDGPGDAADGAGSGHHHRHSLNGHQEASHACAPAGETDAHTIQ